MPRFDPIQTNFSAGEISPRLKGNFQIDKYKQGLQTLENMFVQTHGGVSRRGGSKYVAEVKDSSKVTVLHSFKYKDEFSYILEFGDLYIRFYRSQAQIPDNGSPYEVVTTYVEAELRDLRIAQDEDTLYIVHKNHLPAQLIRTGHATWVLADIDLSHGGIATVDTIVEPDKEVWTLRGSVADNDWKSICWSPERGIFCAVSIDGSNRVMTSPNGTDWTARTAAAAEAWQAVCWSPELSLFCAVAFDAIMTSPNGIAWTSRSAPGTLNWNSVCWSPELGLFCAVSLGLSVGNNVMTSPNGITWTRRVPPEESRWQSVCWSPELGLFCAVAYEAEADYQVMTSLDGITWTGRLSDNANEWYSVCWSPELNLFCAVSSTGTNDRVMTSPDGVTWTERITTDRDWRSVCWSPKFNLFVAVADTGGSNNRVMTSPDGITWTEATNITENDWQAVCWSPELGIFAAVSDSGSGSRVMTGYYGLANGTYTEVELSGGAGEDAEATIVIADYVIDSITITEPGIDYEVDDTLTIDYTDIGGGKGPITCDVATLSLGMPFDWDTANYPTLIWFFEQRLWLASTPDQPNKLWGSKTANYFNFYLGIGLASDGIEVSIKEATKLLWVTTSNVILLGAHNAPFKVSANTLNEALTPTNIRVVRIANYGSAFLPAIDLDGDSIFVQKGLRKIRRLEYDSIKDKHKAADVTILSDHITESGLIDIAYIDEPIPMIFGVRTDGVLVSLTYEPEFGIFGWGRHPVGGADVLVKSIAISDAITADEDELWMIVERTVNSNTVQYIEFLTQGLSPEDVLVDAFFIDSGVTKTGSAFTTFTGLTHLIGETVQVFADGLVQATKVVSGAGEITITAADKAHAGLACDAIIETLPLEGGNPVGSAMGKIKRLSHVVLRLYKSFAFTIGDLIDSNTEDVDLGATLFTDDTEELDFYGDYETGGQMKISITDPVPFTLLAAMYKARTGE